MPAMSFSLLKEMLLSGKKCQTIRKPRKRPLRVGDVLYVYWKQRTKESSFLGITRIIKIVRKSLSELTEEDARKDGFEDLSDLLYAFMQLHGTRKTRRGLFSIGRKEKVVEVDVITFGPLSKGRTERWVTRLRS